MTDERALLIAIPLRHLESAATAKDATVILPAGGPGDLDAVSPGMPVIVMATEAGESEVPAATWQATFVRRVEYELGKPWPDGLPATWIDEHRPMAPASGSATSIAGDPDADDWDDDDDSDDDEAGPQSFLEVSQLRALPRDGWLFANELVRKQARRGRSFRPQVPTIVNLPD